VTVGWYQRFFALIALSYFHYYIKKSAFYATNILGILAGNALISVVTFGIK